MSSTLIKVMLFIFDVLLIGIEGGHPVTRTQFLYTGTHNSLFSCMFV